MHVPTFLLILTGVWKAHIGKRDKVMTRGKVKCDLPALLLHIMFLKGLLYPEVPEFYFFNVKIFL